MKICFHMSLPKNDRGQLSNYNGHNPIIIARLAVAHVRHTASLTRYRFTGGYWRETRFTWNTLFTFTRALLLLATFMQLYFNILNLQQMIIIIAFHGLRRRRLIVIQLHRRILRRRRRRHRPRLWRLHRPMNSWFEIHYNDPFIRYDYFKEQLRIRK